MTDRESVLSALPESCGGERPACDTKVLTVPSGDLWACFVNRLSALGGEVKSIEDLAPFHGRSVYDDDVPDRVKEALGAPVQSVWDAAAGVTVADLAVAETGSLLIAARSGRSRLASLAPPLHVAVLRKEALVASLEEGLARAPKETCFLVSGPSRTADVEGVMVRGVHGPKQLWVVPVHE